MENNSNGQLRIAREPMLVDVQTFCKLLFYVVPSQANGGDVGKFHHCSVKDTAWSTPPHATRSAVPMRNQALSELTFENGSAQFNLCCVTNQPASQCRYGRLYLMRFANGTLPNRGHSPSASNEGKANGSVPCDVSLEFALPERCACRWYRGISATLVAMPEAAVYKDHRAVLGQHQIRSAAHLVGMESEAKAAGVQRSPKHQFRSSVLCPYTRHHAGACLLIHDIGHAYPGL